MFLKNLLNIHEKCISYQFKILSQNYARNKTNEICDRKIFKLQRDAKVFPMLVETPYSGGVINPKTYLIHELGSNIFRPTTKDYSILSSILESFPPPVIWLKLHCRILSLLTRLLIWFWERLPWKITYVFACLVFERFVIFN